MFMSTLAALSAQVGQLAGHSPSPVVYGCVLAASLATLWALLERSERRACQKQNISLSAACRLLTEQHYRERVQAEERHLLAHDSSVRNVLESLERALLGKPRL